MYDGKLLMSQIVKSIPGSFVPAILYLITSSILTRLFSPSEYGIYSLFVVWVTLFSAMASQWLQQGISRYLPGINNLVRAQDLKLAVAVSLGFIIVPLCVLIVILCYIIVLVLGEQSWFSYIIPATALLVASAVYIPLLAILQATFRAGRYSLYQLIDASLRFVVGLSIIFLVQRNLAVLLWASTFSLCLLVPIIWRDNGLPSCWKISIKRSQVVPHIRKIMHYGLPMAGWYIAFTILNSGDRYVIQYARGATEVGIYSANYGLLVGAINLLSGPILNSVHHFLVASWNQGDKSSAEMWLGKIIEWFLFVGILSCALLVIFANDLARILLGPQFYEGARIMPVVMTGLVVWQIGMCTHKPLEFAGKTKTMLVVGVVSAALNLVLNLWLVPLFGYVAAAYTTLAAYAFYALTCLWLGRHILSPKIRWRVMLVVSLYVFLLWIVVSSLRLIIEPYAGYIGGLAATGAIAGIASTFMLAAFVRGRFPSLSFTRA